MILHYEWHILNITLLLKKISQEGMKRANSYLKHGFAIYTAIFFNYRNDIRINREKLK